MFQFCFNDCIPKNGTDDGLVGLLSDSLKHYNTIKEKFPKAVDGIVTDRLPERVFLNASNFSLKDCIGHLNRELFKIASRNFGKYPVEEHYNQVDIDVLLESGFTISINDVEHDATNAKIVQGSDGVLFTLPVHDELRKNSIVISDKAKQTYEALNQYGEESNTSFISEYIQADIIKRAGGFDKLIALVGMCEHTARFKEDFENLIDGVQKKILAHIEHVIERKEKTRFYPDDKKIKDVTPDKEKEIKIFELRVFEPAAIRMYFYETPNKIYLGSISKKPKKKVQDNDILNASSVIKELIILERLKG